MSRKSAQITSIHDSTHQSAAKKLHEIAFIGGSMDSAVGYTHKIAASMDRRWQLNAGCFSQSDDNNQLTADEWGVESRRVYRNARQLIQSEANNLDALVVLTPTPDHLNTVSFALKAGIPVICEKSLTANVEDARRIKELVEKRQGFLAVTYNYSGYPMLRELKARIADGSLGKISQIQVEMPQEGFIRLDTEGKQPQTARLAP